MKIVGHGTGTISNTAKKVNELGVSKAQVDTARWLLLTVETDDVRYRANGEAPTASLGHRLYDGDVLDWTDPNGDYSSMIKELRLIKVTNDATVFVTLYS